MVTKFLKQNILLSICLVFAGIFSGCQKKGDAAVHVKGCQFIIPHGDHYDIGTELHLDQPMNRHTGSMQIEDQKFLDMVTIIDNADELPDDTDLCPAEGYTASTAKEQISVKIPDDKVDDVKAIMKDYQYQIAYDSSDGYTGFSYTMTLPLIDKTE